MISFSLSCTIINRLWWFIIILCQFDIFVDNLSWCFWMCEGIKIGGVFGVVRSATRRSSTDLHAYDSRSCHSYVGCRTTRSHSFSCLRRWTISTLISIKRSIYFSFDYKLQSSSMIARPFLGSLTIWIESLFSSFSYHLLLPPNSKMVSIRFLTISESCD